MSEQTIQNELYSIPVKISDKYICRSLGATTIKDLVKSNEISGITLKECKNIRANKPDVLVLNKNKEIIIFIEILCNPCYNFFSFISNRNANNSLLENLQTILKGAYL